MASLKKPHTDAETFLKPNMVRAVEILLGKKNAETMATVPLSNDTVRRRIKEMSSDVKAKVIAEILTSPFFAIQIDKSTDVSSSAQLLSFRTIRSHG